MASIFNLLHWISGVTLLILGLYCFKKATHKLGLFFCLFLFLLATWAITAALIFNFSALDMKIDLTRIRLVTAAMLPPVIYLLVNELSNNFNISRIKLLVIFFIPTITTLILISPFHELVVNQYQIQTIGNGSILTFANGRWFPIHNLHSRVLILLALFQLARTALTHESSHQRYSWVLFISVLLPFLIDSIAVIFFPTMRYLQMVPVTLTFSAACFYYVISKSNVLEIIPIARNLVMDSISDIYLILDHRQKVIDFNACAKQLLELDEKSYGKSLEDLKFNKITSQIINSLEDGLKNNHFMLTFSENKEFYSISLEKILNHHQDTIGTVIIVKNISEQKKYEMQLSQMAEIRTKFISLIAHDLIGNVASHGLLVESLMEHPTIENDEDLKAQLSLLLNSSQNVTNFIQALLVWSKESAEEIQLKKTLSDLYEIIFEALLYLNPISLQKDINFNVNISKNTLIKIDTNMIQTVFRNILANAIKFSPHNGTITIDAKLGHNATTVTISNDGPLIDEEDINQFLSRFHVKSYKGGLGLTLCREFIHLHEGEIKAVNHQNGPAFIFTLPS